MYRYPGDAYAQGRGQAYIPHQRMAAVRTYMSLGPSFWPHSFDLASENTALMVVDMQVDFFVPGLWFTDIGYDVYRMRHIIPNVTLLVDLFLRKKFPVYFLFTSIDPNLEKQATDRRTPFTCRPGRRLIPELEPYTRQVRGIPKGITSAFEDTTLLKNLEADGVKRLVFTGIVENGLRPNTFPDGLKLGFDCLCVYDASINYLRGMEETNAVSQDLRSGKAAYSLTSQVVEALQIHFADARDIPIPSIE